MGQEGNKYKDNIKQDNEIDWMITVVPFVLIVILCILFFIYPESSRNVLTKIKNISRR